MLEFLKQATKVLHVLRRFLRYLYKIILNFIHHCVTSLLPESDFLETTVKWVAPVDVFQQLSHHYKHDSHPDIGIMFDSFPTCF